MIVAGKSAIAFVVAGVLIGVAGSSTPTAFADSIGPSCGTCQGSTYTLTYTVEGVSGGNTTYDVSLSIDTAGFSPSGGGSGPFYIDSVAVKVSSKDPSGPTELDSAPGSTADWAVYDGGVNAGGCSSAGSGFECAASKGGSAGAVDGFNVTGGTLAWVWDITLPTGSLITSPNGATIKARYVDGKDHKVGQLVSEDITLSTNTAAAEPGTTLLLLCVALAGGGILRKKLLW